MTTKPGVPSSPLSSLLAGRPLVPAQERGIYLHPGQTRCSAEPTTLTTILGSCVAVTLWDSITRVGGMTHFMLPSWDGTGVKSARYGDVAMSELLDQMLDLHANRRALKARIFGGACVLAAFRDTAGGQLGARNVDVAEQALSHAGILVVQKDIAGNSGRKVIFNTSTGDVRMTMVGSSERGF